MSNVDSWNVDGSTIVRVIEPSDNQLRLKHPAKATYSPDPSLDGWTPLVLTFKVNPEDAQALIDELEDAGK